MPGCAASASRISAIASECESWSPSSLASSSRSAQSTYKGAEGRASGRKNPPARTGKSRALKVEGLLDILGASFCQIGGVKLFARGFQGMTHHLRKVIQQ